MISLSKSRLHSPADPAEPLAETTCPELRVPDLQRRPGVDPDPPAPPVNAELVRRLFDIVVASMGLAITAPLMLFAGILIRCVSPGPVLYCQPREGKSGNVFRMWKLRTMYVDAEQRLQRVLSADEDARQQWEHFAKFASDPRIIPVIGQFLRKSSCDELPQFWNVLRGDMSIIGPRPLPKYHIERFAPEFWRLRRRVKPGITGLWQVLGRSDGDFALQHYDSIYLRTRSLSLDAYILMRTLVVMVKGTGR